MRSLAIWRSLDPALRAQSTLSHGLALTAFALAVCVSIASCGDHPPIDPHSFQAKRLSGTVVRASDGGGVGGVGVTIEATGQTVTTASDGSFEADEVPTSRVLLSFSDGSQNVYTLQVNEDLDVVSARFVVDPIFGVAETAGIQLEPAPDAPGGAARIIEPADGSAIACEGSPAPCRFVVRGTASPLLGSPGTEFFLFVFVTPISPSGGGTFPQFPAVSVDPATGAWTTEVQVGGIGSLQAQVGDEFQILALVTTERLSPRSPEDPLRFDRPVDVPGVVHVSRFVNLSIGSRPEAFVSTPQR